MKAVATSYTNVQISITTLFFFPCYLHGLNFYTLKSNNALPWPFFSCLSWWMGWSIPSLSSQTPPLTSSCQLNLLDTFVFLFSIFIATSVVETPLIFHLVMLRQLLTQISAFGPPPLQFKLLPTLPLTLLNRYQRFIYQTKWRQIMKLFCLKLFCGFSLTLWWNSDTPSENYQVLWDLLSCRSNPCPLHWRLESIHCTTRDILPSSFTWHVTNTYVYDTYHVDISFLPWNLSTGATRTLCLSPQTLTHI